MKKELNGKSRRKFVVGGAMVFGSIALLSTGFATWVIGASQTSANIGIDVTVDGVQNKNVELVAELVENETGVKFADPAVDAQPVHTDGTDEDNKVNIKLTATVATSWLGTATNPGKVGITFFDKSNLIPAASIIGAHTEAKVTAWKNRTADARKAEGEGANDSFVVFDNAQIANTTLNQGWQQVGNEVNGTKVFERLMTITVKVGGAGLYGTKNTFAEYVNSIYGSDLVGAGKTFANKIEMYGDIEKEMKAETDAITTHFGSNPLKVTVSVGTDAPTPESN